MAIIIVFLLFAVIPISWMAYKTPKYIVEIAKNVEGSTSTSDLRSWSKEQINPVRGDNPQEAIFSYKSMR